MTIRHQCVAAGFPHPAAVALVVHEERVLLCMRGNKNSAHAGEWCLPGGLIEHDQEPHEAVIAELREETGVIGDLLQLLDSYLVRSTIGSKHQTVEILFLVAFCERLEKSDHDDETRESAFFALDELPENIAFGHREVILRNWPKVTPRFAGPRVLENAAFAG